MAETLRRIVTGHNGKGRSVVTIDGPPGEVLEMGAAALYEVWSTDGPKVESTGSRDMSQGPVRLSPPPTGSKFRFFTVPPTDPSIPREALEAAAAEAFAAIGAAEERVDTTRHPLMHKTKTIDYILLLRGQVTLLLDEEERDLRPFDVVVQRGTNHAWVNKGKETALLAAILLDAEIAE